MSYFSGIAARASVGSEPAAVRPQAAPSSSIAVGAAPVDSGSADAGIPALDAALQGSPAPEASGLAASPSIELGPSGLAPPLTSLPSRVPSVIVERSANTASDSSLSPPSVSVPISTGHTPLADGTVQSAPPARLEWVAQSRSTPIASHRAPGTPSEAALPTSVQEPLALANVGRRSAQRAAESEVVSPDAGPKRNDGGVSGVADALARVEAWMRRPLKERAPSDDDTGSPRAATIESVSPSNRASGAESGAGDAFGTTARALAEDFASLASAPRAERDHTEEPGAPPAPLITIGRIEVEVVPPPKAARQVVAARGLAARSSSFDSPRFDSPRAPRAFGWRQR